MKLIALLITFCFSMNVFASTGTIGVLEKHLDDYHYALSVEWDQKDAEFQDKVTKEFFAKMQKLMTEEGLTQEQVIALIETKMNDKAAVEALKLRLSLMGEAKSSEELAELLRQSSTEFYTEGASWHGAFTAVAITALVLVTALTFAVWFSATHGCVEYEQTCDIFGCRNSRVCRDYGYIGPHL